MTYTEAFLGGFISATFIYGFLFALYVFTNKNKVLEKDIFLAKERINLLTDYTERAYLRQKLNDIEKFNSESV